MTYRIDARTWPELVAEKRRAEAEASEKELTLQEKLDLASERVHHGTASTKPRTATIVRSPDEGLRRFFELVAELKKP